MIILVNSFENKNPFSMNINVGSSRVCVVLNWSDSMVSVVLISIPADSVNLGPIVTTNRLC